MTTSQEALADRFWSKVAKPIEPDACWNWIAGCFEDGYGAFSSGTTTAGNNRVVKAHRLAFELLSGTTLPSKTLLLHHCDNKRCCNPRHLYVGTYADNMFDRTTRGIHRPHHRINRINTEELRRRRKAGERVKDLAKEFGVSRQHVWRVSTQ